MKTQLLISALWVASTTLALPLSNPKDPAYLSEGLINPSEYCCELFHLPQSCQKLNLRMGFYGDYVFQRGLEVYGMPGYPDGNKDLLETSLFTNAGLITLNYKDRWEVFGTLGSTCLFFSGDCKAFNVAPLYNIDRDKSWLTGVVSVETLAGFSWSVGGKGILYEKGCTTIGIEGQYFSFSAPFKTVERTNTAFVQARVDAQEWIGIDATGLTYPNRLLSANYCEWQVGLGIAQQVGWAVPYAGIKLSSARLMMDHAQLGIQNNSPPGDPTNVSPIFYNARSSKHWGYAIGCSIISEQKGELTIEGRFADETACYIDCQFRF